MRENRGKIKMANRKKHIGMVDGDFYASGWSREAVVTRHFEERLDRPGKMDQILCELRQLKKELHSGNCVRSGN